MQKHVAGLFVVALFVFTFPAFAQNPLVGTWDLVSTTLDGKQASPPASSSDCIQPGVTRQIYSADGFYIVLSIPKGRTQPTNPRDQWTKDDWQKLYGGVSVGVWGNFGTYSVSGDKLTRRTTAAVNPTNEGKESVVTFRVEGAVLVLPSTRPNGTKVEEQWQRVK